MIKQEFYSPKDMKEIRIPENSVLVIALTEDEKVFVLDDKGNLARECVLPKKTYGEYLEEKQSDEDQKSLPPCTSCINATLHEITSITILHSSTNPYCWTTDVNGTRTQRCKCRPGEVDERCS